MINNMQTKSQHIDGSQQRPLYLSREKCERPNNGAKDDESPEKLSNKFSSKY